MGLHYNASRTPRAVSGVFTKRRVGKKEEPLVEPNESLKFVHFRGARRTTCGLSLATGNTSRYLEDVDCPTCLLMQPREVVES